MKIPSRVDGSVCGAVLTNRPSAGLRKATPATGSRPIKRTRSFCTARDASSEPASAKTRPGSRFFCPRTPLWLLSTFTPSFDAGRPVRFSRARDVPRAYSAAAAAPQPPASWGPVLRSDQDREDLLSLVPREDGDSEDVGTVDEHLEYHRDVYRTGYAPSNGPVVHVSDRKQDLEYPSRKEAAVALDDDLRGLIDSLLAAISRELRHPARISLERIYYLYCKLPEPKMLCLSFEWRDRLMNLMGTPRKRDTESMLRYFALVSDVRSAGLALRREHWNHALTLGTKYTSHVSVRDMESGLQLWREMERGAKIPADDVTFNILFDVAAKSGKFVLAEMIYKEMDLRGFTFNRYHHVTLIYYFGLRLDSGGIRAAYREMVASGEVIDTVVLNCVLGGLLRCGEESAAEETYARMRDGHDWAVHIPPQDYVQNKIATKVLMMFAKVGKKHPQLYPTLQAGVRPVPNLRTYELLVKHYAVRVGNLAKVAQFLDEMKHLQIPIHATIFTSLFKGFFAHGGFDGSDWSERRLDKVLSALFQAHDAHAREFRIEKWMAVWALRALKRCSTDVAVLEGFENLAERWQLPEEEQAFVRECLGNILSGRDMTSNREGMGHRSRRTDGSRT